MINTITTKKLGLAAFMKVKGAVLKGKDTRGFTFESEVTREQWEVDYANSGEAAFNSALIELNQLNREQ